MADRVFKLKFLGDIGHATGEIDKLGAKFGAMGTKTKAAVGAAAIGGAAIGAVAVAGFKSAIAVAMDYEYAIDAIAATAQASEADTKKLWDTGLRIGQDTKFSAQQAAEAMNELAAGGVSVEDILGGAADATVSLAAAADVDLAAAASLAAQAMTVWKLGTSDLTDVVNRSAGVALKSKFTAEDLALAIGQGGGVAAQAGVDFADFSTAITATAASFNSGSDAGTSFKVFLMGLTPKTKPAIKAMKELGLMTADGQNQFYTASGELKSFAEITGLLHDAFAGLTEEQAAATREVLFGTDGMRMAGAIASMTADDFNKLKTAMGDTDALALAKQRMDNAKSSMEQMQGAIEVMQITVGAALLPVVKMLANFAADVLPMIPSGVILAVGALALFIGMLAALSLAITPILLLATSLGIGIGGVALAFLAIPAAIAAVIAAGYLLFTHWDELTAKAAGVRDAVLSTVGLGEGTPANKPAQVATNALAQGGIAAIPVLGQVYGAVRGAKSFQNLVPKFASGGMVPGSGPQLAIVHGGEQVLTRSQQQGAGNVYNFNFAGSLHTDAGLQELILQAQRTIAQRGGSLA
jgi:TP901 family phage tail tape measure protein